MKCIQNEKSLNTGINKLNWRFNYMFSDHKSGVLLYIKYDIHESITDSEHFRRAGNASGFSKNVFPKRNVPF